MQIDAPLRDRMSGLDLATAGCHRLDGAQALALVRARRLEALGPGGWVEQSGDAERTDRQREVVALLFDQLRTAALDPVALDGWATWAGEHLQRDTAVDHRRLVELVGVLASLDTIDAVGPELPVVGVRGDDGAAVLRVPVDAAASVAAFEDPVPSGVDVTDVSRMLAPCP